MHFTRPLAALLAVSLSAHAAPSPRTSLTKRWCGFEISCHCHVDVKAGCIPQFDECGKQWFWPLACSQCGKCSELCVDFFQCIPDAYGEVASTDESAQS